MVQSIIVETVIPLSTDQKAVVSTLLKSKFGTPSFTEKLNPSILGGVRIMVGSTQYDATLAGKLAQLRHI
ncbi:MAG: F0F1 ATP synthase subunit delta [Patescibacteria group bacterium]